jgi:hypothetical protein
LLLDDRMASALAYVVTPNHGKYDGVRPLNIYLLRVFYFLMAAFVATDAWTAIVTHEGPWDRFRAVSLCVWAAYGTLSLLGLIHPLKMLPIMLFMIFYKSLWLIAVAYPLWRTGALSGSPVEEMARVFVWVPLPALAVPWGYVVRNYVLSSRPTMAREQITSPSE